MNECEKCIMAVKDALEVSNGRWKLPILVSLKFSKVVLEVVIFTKQSILSHQIHLRNFSGLFRDVSLKSRGTVSQIPIHFAQQPLPKR